MGRPLPAGIADDIGVTTDGEFRGSAPITRVTEGDELFERSWRVTIQTTAANVASGETDASPGKALETTEHDVQFKITKSIKSEPNKCTLTIYNLNREQREAIAALNPDTKLVHVRDAKKIRAAARKAPKGIGVKIEAGYGGKNSLIWLGDMRTGESEYISPNWVTKLTSGDGEKSWQNARVNVSYGPKTPTSTALRAMVKALGLGPGNVEEFLASKTGLTKQLYPQGTVMSGPVHQLLDDYCRSADIEWCIVDGCVQFTGRGEKLKNSAILISKETGMIGSPKVDVDRVLTVKTLMIPDVRPGRLIVVRSSSPLPRIVGEESILFTDAVENKGNYRAEQIIWDGDSAGANWGLTIRATMY